ncbi:MAG: hypothetical protein EZS28_044283, partial [Streblomastix strix]
CYHHLGPHFFLFYYETLPLGPLPPDPLLVYEVIHKKQIRKAIKKVQVQLRNLKVKSQRLKVKTNSESLVIDRSAGMGKK